MPHETPLIATIVAGLVLAFTFDLLPQRLRIRRLRTIFSPALRWVRSHRDS